MNPIPATPKKVAALPVDGTDEVKQTNEIGMFIPLLEGMDIAGKTITADALLTQRTLARYLLEERVAHSLFITKDNQLDWNWDENRCTIRTGHGPENITRLRRFATGLIKSKSRDSVAATIAKLARNVRRIFDYLGMTKNSLPQRRGPVAEVG